MGFLNWFGFGNILSRQAIILANMPQDDGEYHPHRSRDEAIKARKARKKAKAAKAARRRNRGK